MSLTIVLDWAEDYDGTPIREAIELKDGDPRPGSGVFEFSCGCRFHETGVDEEEGDPLFTLIHHCRDGEVTKREEHSR